MTIQDSYLYFLNIVEKNSTNNNLNVDKPRFIEWFNYSISKYQEDVLKRGRRNDEIRELSPFLKMSDDLIEKESNDLFDIFYNPDNYFDLSSVLITAKKGACSVNDFILDEQQSENVHIKLTDENYKPSFKARETFYTLMDGGVAIYHNSDFKIDSARMLYYKPIPKVDISGYIKQDGSSSTD